MSSSTDHSVENNTLRLTQSGAKASFLWPIAEVVPKDDVFVVRVDPEPDACFNENVYGVSTDGKILWQIAERQHVYADSPYTKILLTADGVVLFNWDGDELLVDPVSGKVLRAAQGK